MPFADLPRRHHSKQRQHEEFGRGERIRTSGLYVPNVALYQAKLHPDEAGRAPAYSTGSYEERSIS